MRGDVFFLVVIGGFSLAFAMYNLVCTLRTQHKSGVAVGVVAAVFMPNPATEKRLNSKWAEVRYSVDGKIYTSDNRVQIPMTLQVGDRIKVRYDTELPTHLYSFSFTRVFVALAVAAGCFAAAVLMYSGVL